MKERNLAKLGNYFYFSHIVTKWLITDCPLSMNPNSVTNALCDLKTSFSKTFYDFKQMSHQGQAIIFDDVKWLKDRKGRTYFKKEDIDAFLSFGHALGGDDCQWQISNIDMTIKKLLRNM